MTVYEKHIRELVELRDAMYERYADDVLPAIDSAIELMRAAEPKDEAAEREYCTREWSRILKDKQEPAVAWLMVMRAQTRAEGYAHGQKNLDEVCERADEQELPIGRLRREADEHDRELDTEIAAHNVARDQLAAAQAELAERKAKHLEDYNRLRDVAAWRDEVETKLVNLRTAAERSLLDINHMPAREALRAAIEESKK